MSEQPQGKDPNTPPLVEPMTLLLLSQTIDQKVKELGPVYVQKRIAADEPPRRPDISFINFEENIPRIPVQLGPIDQIQVSQLCTFENDERFPEDRQLQEIIIHSFSDGSPFMFDRDLGSVTIPPGNFYSLVVMPEVSPFLVLDEFGKRGVSRHTQIREFMQQVQSGNTEPPYYLSDGECHQMIDVMNNPVLAEHISTN